MLSRSHESADHRRWYRPSSPSMPQLDLLHPHNTSRLVRSERNYGNVTLRNYFSLPGHNTIKQCFLIIAALCIWAFACANGIPQLYHIYQVYHNARLALTCDSLLAESTAGWLSYLQRFPSPLAHHLTRHTITNCPRPFFFAEAAYDSHVSHRSIAS